MNTNGIEQQHAPVPSVNVLAPIAYLGVDQNTPYGQMIDTSLNAFVTTVAGVTSINLNISTNLPFFLTAIYLYCSTGTIYVKPSDGEGNEIFTGFYLTNTAGTDPFPVFIPIPFKPNDNSQIFVKDAVGNNKLEIIYRGYTLSGVSA